MEILNKLAIHIQNLQHRQFQKYTIIFLCAVTFLLGLFTYFIHQKKHDLIDQMKQLHKLTEQSFHIIADNRKMVKAEQSVLEMLAKEKDFTMQGFFEQFCREQNINPEAGWDARSEPVNDKFDEIVLHAVFRGQNTEKLVHILDALDKKNIIYIKELTIHNEGNQKINVEITLATKKYKSILD